MGSLCFSSASILRCESFTSFQSQILIIPTALELIFSTTLVITNWGTGWSVVRIAGGTGTRDLLFLNFFRRHLLLTAEGWSYFGLALLELLSHNIPAVRDNVSVFSIVDIVLGAPHTRRANYTTLTSFTPRGHFFSSHIFLHLIRLPIHPRRTHRHTP
jgi:hypothetical protein